MLDQTSEYRYLTPSGQIEFPAKINIHFSLKGSVSVWCADLSARVTQITENEVDLQPSSFQVPHITLYMGYVATMGHLQSVLLKTEQLSRILPPCSITVSGPYLKEPKKNWAFLDVGPTEKLMSIKRAVKEVLQGDILPLRWDVVGEAPHITVAYIQDKIGQVEEFLTSATGVRDSSVEIVTVSFCGRRGSCLGAIRSFELRGE